MLVMESKRNWQLFWCSVFFVLGFSVVFAALGVLLQGILANVSSAVQKWLGRIGGLLIIAFGLYLLGLIKIKALEVERQVQVKKKFKSSYITSFVFGAAFAVGWTPCVGAVLGAVLTLAVSQPGSAFFLLLAYSLGLGIPFLVVGIFMDKAKQWIDRSAKWMKIVQYVFGIILIGIGILVFTNQLSRIASFGPLAAFFIELNVAGVSATSVNLGIAFVAGIVSFLNPCVLPLLPGFLTYLASVGVKE